MSTLLSVLTTCKRTQYVETTLAAFSDGGADLSRVVFTDSRWYVAPPPWGTHFCGAFSAIESMLEIFRYAIEGGFSQLLFCEDDIEPCKGFLDYVSQLEVPEHLALLSFHDFQVFPTAGIHPVAVDKFLCSNCLLIPRRVLTHFTPRRLGREKFIYNDFMIRHLICRLTYSHYGAVSPRMVKHVGVESISRKSSVVFTTPEFDPDCLAKNSSFLCYRSQK